MDKPDWCPQDVWGDAKGINDCLWAITDTEDRYWQDTAVIARAILAAKAEAHRDLVDCLSDMTEHYVELAGCGDCGFWDPEQEIEVIAARKMIAANRVSTAHKSENQEA